MTGTGGRCSLTEPEVLAGYTLKEEATRRSKAPFVGKLTTAFIRIFLRPHVSSQESTARTGGHYPYEIYAI